MMDVLQIPEVQLESTQSSDLKLSYQKNIEERGLTLIDFVF